MASFKDIGAHERTVKDIGAHEREVAADVLMGQVMMDLSWVWIFLILLM